MRLAVGQAQSSHDLDINVAAVVDLVEQTASAGGRLLLLSELFLNGYDLDEINKHPQAIAVTDPRLGPIRRSCRAEGVSAIVGAATAVALPESDEPYLHNSALWFGSDGSVRNVYDKIHLWAGERASFAPGERGVLLKFGGLTIGIGICYDAGFPEFCRAYAQAGADLILFASAFAMGNERTRYHIYNPARALESGAFVAVSNALGQLGGSVFFGESVIYDPYGVPVADAGDRPGVALIDVDRDVVNEAKASLQYLQDLKTDYDPIETEEELP